MRIYWTLKSIPELKGLSKIERQRIYQSVPKKIFGHWQMWLGLFIGGLFGGLGTLIGHYIGTHSELGVIIGATIGFVVGGFVGGFITKQFAFSLTRPYLRKYLATQKL